MAIISQGFSIPIKAISKSQFALSIRTNLISSVAVLALTLEKVLAAIAHCNHSAHMNVSTKKAMLGIGKQSDR